MAEYTVDIGWPFGGNKDPAAETPGPNHKALIQIKDLLVEIRDIMRDRSDRRDDLRRSPNNSRRRNDGDWGYKNHSPYSPENNRPPYSPEYLRQQQDQQYRRDANENRRDANEKPSAPPHQYHYSPPHHERESGYRHYPYHEHHQSDRRDTAPP